MVAPGGLAARVGPRLRADASRVVATLFVPGHALPGGGEDRVSGVVEHVMALSDAQVSSALAAIFQSFSHRHRDLQSTLLVHAARLENRVGSGVELSDERRTLLGAVFTQEYAVEAAALCNPSMVAVEVVAGPGGDYLRFVMSVRQIGEGHRSSIGFRSGLVDQAGDVTLDPLVPFATVAEVTPSVLDVESFRGLAQRSEDAEAVSWVLDHLGPTFSAVELDTQLDRLRGQRDTRRGVVATVERLHGLAARSYTASFAASSLLAERTLMPAIAVESNGLEDARFVRFSHDNGAVEYLATYTAFDGRALAQQLLATDDFATFTSTPLLGPAAANKGMALFPRRVGGKFVALSRHDGAANSIAFSDNIHEWDSVIPLDCPTSLWESVQVGNCGPPIETDAGWLVLTHGVGPMRTYAIGAWLLDIEDPTRLIGRLREPLLMPLPGERDGYVPNVVYSCGSLVHASRLVIPFGIADASIGFASIDLPELLGALLAGV